MRWRGGKPDSGHWNGDQSRAGEIGSTTPSRRHRVPLWAELLPAGNDLDFAGIQTAALLDTVTEE
jgi:hypothetical protein